MTDPTSADLAARIARLPAAERALVISLVERFDKLTTPAPRTRRRLPPLPDLDPEVEARVLRDLGRRGFVPSR